jgi:hypothetical protein
LWIGFTFELALEILEREWDGILKGKKKSSCKTKTKRFFSKLSGNKKVQEMVSVPLPCIMLNNNKKQEEKKF